MNNTPAFSFPVSVERKTTHMTSCCSLAIQNHSKVVSTLTGKNLLILAFNSGPQLTRETKFEISELPPLNLNTFTLIACAISADSDQLAMSCRRALKFAYFNCLPVNTDFDTTTTKRVPNVMDVWNTLGSRCTIVAGSLC